MTAAILNLQITDSQLAKYAKLIYDRAGIRISPQKKTLLSNRLRRRLRATELESFDDYFRIVSKLSDKDPEWDAFLQEITTHETYLFRDMSHWDWFQDEYLKQRLSLTKAGKIRKSLRIWSAACSTGDEACTIATCIASAINDTSQWKIEIVGTDIGIGAVEVAKEATFGGRAMQHVPDSSRRKYFDACKSTSTWTAKSTLTQWMKFHTHNLLNPLPGPPFDVIFLKNVLIYFDTPSKQKVLVHLLKSLKKTSYLVTGAAEGVSDLLQGLQRETAWRHFKP
ncbi:MAG: protein-glutamate O-methyltransferase CheR [Pirellulales bacterium]